MKRILVVTVLIAVVAIVGAIPYWFGVEAERMFHRQMKLLDASGKTDVVNTRFERGWFSSEAETEFGFSRFQTTVTARHTVEHGPVPVSDPLQYLFSLHPLQALIRSQFSVARGGRTITTGTLHTGVNMDGSARTRIMLPAAKTALEPSGELAWEQISGHIDFQSGETPWTGELRSAGIDWSENGSAIKTGSVALRFSSYMGSTGLALGESTLTAASVRARLQAIEDPLAAEGLTINSTAIEQGESVSYTLGADVAAANLGGLTIDAGEWRLQANNLDRDTLTRLNTMEAGAAFPLNDLITLIAKRHAELVSSMQLATESGPFTADAVVTLSAKDGTTTSPLMLLGALQGRLDLAMPAAMVELAAEEALRRERSDPAADGGVPARGDVEQQKNSNTALSGKIQSWIDNNMLTRQGDRYQFQASIANGEVKLNGQNIDFMSLLR